MFILPFLSFNLNHLNHPIPFQTNRWKWTSLEKHSVNLTQMMIHQLLDARIPCPWDHSGHDTSYKRQWYCPALLKICPYVAAHGNDSEHRSFQESNNHRLRDICIDDYSTHI